MAAGTKICKYCGIEYPACKTVFKPGVFRWRDVACSPEHAAKYLEQITASRAEQPAKAEVAKQSKGDSAAPVEPMAGGSGVTHTTEEIADDAPPKKIRRRRMVEAEDPVD